MSDLLRVRPAATPAMLAIFSDAAVIRHALRFEAALACAQAAEGLIGKGIADAIADLCGGAGIDPADLAERATLAGTLAIPLLALLRAELPPPAAEALHRGATSQDLADTVLMMQVVQATALLAVDLDRVRMALHALAELHAATPAIGRTLLQDAVPIGFGLRLAQAAAGVGDAGRRLEGEVAVHARVQLGGPAGSRAGLGGKGAAIAARMAGELGLVAGVPWHANRTGVAAIAAAVGIVIGALAKLARDISLLAQNAIGEVREPAIPGRGGSSSMGHKRNPTGCQVALSAAIRAPGLVAAVLAALPAEEERGLGGWQAEGPALADLFLLAAGSAAAMADVAEGLEIDEAAIARNLAAASVVDGIGESAAIVSAILAQYRKG
ncbi:fumarate lyase [Rhizorhabdus wittichii RW1]|uniref:Fumarate lyase n=1 Tax=Rhizorhabdus wittichii (strain DSM 6014 / CCUG 31198 / JCM 15750 / NBRC 105917 / EY 4224 / RW1) TaxID=392499 RepID=A0A9J9H9Q2_RHIWR|nr:fumarate lyase [Rhizorhabdus wittichii RW1]